MTESERLDQQKLLQDKCDIWRNLLALNEWDIEIHVYDGNDESLFETKKVKFTRNTGKAYIPFPFQDEMAPAWAIEDEEKEMLHHLLLIRFEMVNNDNVANEIYYQRALMMVVNALMQLKEGYDNYKALLAEYSGLMNELEDKKEKEKFDGKEKLQNKTYTKQKTRISETPEHKKTKSPIIIG